MNTESFIWLGVFGVVSLPLLAAFIHSWVKMRHLEGRRRQGQLEAEVGIPLIGLGECRKCHKSLIANARFCSACGTEVVEDVRFCPKCQARNYDDAVFCGMCGHRFAEGLPPVQQHTADFLERVVKR